MGSIPALIYYTRRNVLTSKQRAYVRSLAHSLTPAVHIGKEGVSEAAIRNVKEAFNNREVLKVRVLEAAPLSAREAAEALAGQLEDTHVVQVIGRTVVLYRPHPEKPRIQLSR
jgi:RNA-binding protein